MAAGLSEPTGNLEGGPAFAAATRSAMNALNSADSLPCFSNTVLVQSPCTVGRPGLERGFLTLSSIVGLTAGLNEPTGNLEGKTGRGALPAGLA